MIIGTQAIYGVRWYYVKGNYIFRKFDDKLIDVVK